MLFGPAFFRVPGIGLLGDASLKYERSVRADRYLLIAHASQEPVERTRAIIECTGSIETDCFDVSELQQQASQSVAAARFVP
jgi:hypothetical protein